MRLDSDKEPTAPLITIVDDEAGVREALVSLLRSAGYSTADYSCAESFLAAPAASQTRCIVLDLHMPGINGLDLQQRLADRQPKISIIFISAQATEQQKGRATHAGAIAFLNKPFRDQALLEAIAVALR
jgi:FixJ family two-component response regulator